jgi:hypothetical protein
MPVGVAFCKAPHDIIPFPANSNRTSSSSSNGSLPSSSEATP